MRPASDLRIRRKRWRVPRALPYVLGEIALLALLAWAVARLFWTLLASAGPVGAWPAAVPGVAASDPALLGRFDPFFRLSDTSGPAVVTSLPLRLTGTRLDQAMGRGSAIILTPDGVQASFAVGDEIVPGVILKSVAFDSVTVERGGVAEQLFLDQSTPAPVAAAGPPPPPGTPVTNPIVANPLVSAAPTSGVVSAAPKGTGMGVAMTPRVEKGIVTGFVVTPQGSSGAFAAAGLQAGDVLVQVNGNGIRSPEEAAQVVANTPPNGEIVFSVDRGGKIVTLITKVPK